MPKYKGPDIAKLLREPDTKKAIANLKRNRIVNLEARRKREMEEKDRKLVEEAAGVGISEPQLRFLLKLFSRIGHSHFDPHARIGPC